MTYSPGNVLRTISLLQASSNYIPFFLCYIFPYLILILDRQIHMHICMGTKIHTKTISRYCAVRDVDLHVFIICRKHNHLNCLFVLVFRKLSYTHTKVLRHVQYIYINILCVCHRSTIWLFYEFKLAPFFLPRFRVFRFVLLDEVRVFFNFGSE